MVGRSTSSMEQRRLKNGLEPSLRQARERVKDPPASRHDSSKSAPSRDHAPISRPPSPQTSSSRRHIASTRALTSHPASTPFSKPSQPAHPRASSIKSILAQPTASQDSKACLTRQVTHRPTSIDRFPSANFSDRYKLSAIRVVHEPPKKSSKKRKSAQTDDAERVYNMEDAEEGHWEGWEWVSTPAKSKMPEGFERDEVDNAGKTSGKAAGNQEDTARPADQDFSDSTNPSTFEPLPDILPPLPAPGPATHVSAPARIAHKRRTTTSTQHQGQRGKLEGDVAQDKSFDPQEAKLKEPLFLEWDEESGADVGSAIRHTAYDLDSQPQRRAHIPPFRPVTRRSRSKQDFSCLHDVPPDEDIGYRPPQSGQRVTRRAAQLPISAIRNDPTPREQQAADPFWYLSKGRYDGEDPPQVAAQQALRHSIVSPNTPSPPIQSQRPYCSEPALRSRFEEKMARSGLQPVQTYSKRKRIEYLAPKENVPLDDGISYAYDRRKRSQSTSLWPPSAQSPPESPFDPDMPDSPLILPGDHPNQMYDEDSEGEEDELYDDLDERSRPTKRYAAGRNGPWPQARVDGLFEFDPNDEVPRRLLRERGDIVFTEAFHPNPLSQYTPPDYVIQRHNGRLQAVKKSERRGERVNRSFGFPHLVMTASTQGQNDLDRYIREVPRRNRGLWQQRNPKARPPIMVSTRPVVRKRRPTALVAAEKAARGHMKTIQTVPFDDQAAAEEIKRRSSKRSMVVNPDLISAGQREVRQLGLLNLTRKQAKRREREPEPRVEGSLPSEGIATLTPSQRPHQARPAKVAPARPGVGRLTFTRTVSPEPARVPNRNRRPLSTDTPTELSNQCTKPRGAEDTDSAPDSRTTSSGTTPTLTFTGGTASQPNNAYKPQPVGEAERLGSNLPLQRAKRIKAQVEEQKRRDTAAYIADIKNNMVEDNQEDTDEVDIFGQHPTGSPFQALPSNGVQEELAGVLDRLAEDAEREAAEGGELGDWADDSVTVVNLSPEKGMQASKRLALLDRQDHKSHGMAIEDVGQGREREASWEGELREIEQGGNITASQVNRLLSDAPGGNDLKENDQGVGGVDRRGGEGEESVMERRRKVPESSLSQRGALTQQLSQHRLPADRSRRQGRNDGALSRRPNDPLPQAVTWSGPAQGHAPSSSSRKRQGDLPAPLPMKQQYPDQAKTPSPSGSWPDAPHLDENPYQTSPQSHRSRNQSNTTSTSQRKTQALKSGMSGMELTEYLHGFLQAAPEIKSEIQLKKDQRRRRVAEKKKMEGAAQRTLTEYRGFEEREERARLLERMEVERQHNLTGTGREAGRVGSSNQRRLSSDRGKRADDGGEYEDEGEDQEEDDMQVGDPAPGRRRLSSGMIGRALSRATTAYSDFVSPTQLNTPTQAIGRSWSRKAISTTHGQRRQEQQWADTTQSRGVLQRPFRAPSLCDSLPLSDSSRPEEVRRRFDPFTDDIDDGGERHGEEIEEENRVDYMSLGGSGDRYGLAEGDEDPAREEGIGMVATGQVADKQPVAVPGRGGRVAVIPGGRSKTHEPARGAATDRRDGHSAAGPSRLGSIMGDGVRRSDGRGATKSDFRPPLKRSARAGGGRR